MRLAPAVLAAVLLAACSKSPTAVTPPVAPSPIEAR